VLDRFNDEHEAEYGYPMTAKWIGYMLRIRLKIATRKSGGIYIVPASERPKVEALRARYGLPSNTKPA
jgi:hypothetical protein